jgi:putative oxidoreductase
VTHVLLRIGAGLFFMMHGGQKLLGWFPMPDGPHGAPPIGSMMGIAGILELVGGSLLVLGLLTRVVAFILAGEMAVAYYTAHLPHGTWPIQNHGEPAVLFFLIFLFLFGNGDGGFSLDALIRRARHRPAYDDRPPVVTSRPATAR